MPDDIADIMGPGRFFDFGTADSPVAPGYTQVVPTTAYSAAAGFGWLLGPGETVTAADQSGTTRVASALKRDFNATSAGTFAVDVPNGTYDVTVTLGDAAQRTMRWLSLCRVSGVATSVPWQVNSLPTPIARR